ncbi:RNA polymerase sigma factor (sigma-70 family) [Alkalibacillus flavidus]|uniref:RNA polymerase sigma factor (Sigma-70 family) n=1 Tax=Alkalibacillus flavidus TaxID=546021 RepID=A0ABV2KX22_9BACI
MDNQTFHDLLKQYNRMIHYHIHRLNIRDTHGDFYQEGLVALWTAWQKYGHTESFPKMASIQIRSRLIDLIRKRKRIQDNEESNEYIAEQPYTQHNLEQFDPYFWSTVRSHLSDKQWLFIQKRIIEGHRLADIAQSENTTIDAVKGWGQAAKRKLKIALKDYQI